jgi:hypothetical protein
MMKYNPPWCIAPSANATDPHRGSQYGQRRYWWRVSIGKPLSQYWDLQMSGTYAKTDIDRARYQQQTLSVDALYMFSPVEVATRSDSRTSTKSATVSSGRNFYTLTHSKPTEPSPPSTHSAACHTRSFRLSVFHWRVFSRVRLCRSGICWDRLWD